MPTEVRSGVGRIVWGNPGKPQKKTDQRTGQPVLKDGQQVMQWVCGVAFPKAEFGSILWPAMHAEALTGYPSGQFPPDFSWKYKDGDTGIARDGKPFNTREGYPGCHVLTISTEAFPPPIFKLNPQTGQYDTLTGDQIKPGDFVVVKFRFVVNVAKDRSKNSSLYINPLAFELVGYGKEIISAAAVDPNEAFGRQQYQLPPGASLMPVAPTPTAGYPGMPQAPVPGYAPPPMAPQPGYAPQAPQSYAPPPAPGYPPQPGAPAPMPGYPQQPAPGYAPAPQIPVTTGYAPQPGAPLPPPAHDFIPGYQPPPAPGYPPQPGAPAPMPGYPQQPAPGQPPVPGYAPMPGMMPPR